MVETPAPTTGSPAAVTDERLESWKGIAGYLRRSVRTARRWEKDEGLPVHRHLHKKLGTVYAQRSELDAWWQSRRARLEAQPEPTEAAPPRRKWTWPALLAGLLATLLAVGYLVRRGRQPGSTAEAGRPTAPAAADRMMLAVLPFENLGPDAEDEYLSEGLTEEVTSQLGRLRPERLGVIARTSAAQYTKTGRDVRELGVGYVLEGSVRREGARVRITAQLVRTADQTQVWTGSYDRPLGDTLQLQSDVAHAVAGEIRLQLPGAQAGPSRPAVPEAYEAYLRGRYLAERRTSESLRRALAWFDRAIAADPQYAAARAGLAHAHVLTATYADVATRVAMARAREAALHALRLDPELAEGHAVLGTVLAEYDWDWASAEAELRQAVALNENYADAHRLYAEYLSYVGRFDEAVGEAKRARDLDPLSPVSHALLGMMLYRARRYDEALEQLERTIDMEPNHPLAYLGMGLAYSQNGLHPRAVAALEKGRALSGDSSEFVAQLGYARARAGQPAEARTLLRELQGYARRQYVSPFLFAIVHTGLGERPQALDWLEKGYADRDWLLCVLKTEPILDPLRSEPRFRDLLRRMGLLESIPQAAVLP